MDKAPEGMGVPLDKIQFKDIYVGMRVVCKTSYTSSLENVTFEHLERYYIGTVVGKEEGTTCYGGVKQLIIKFDEPALSCVVQPYHFGSLFFLEEQK